MTRDVSDDAQALPGCGKPAGAGEMLLPGIDAGPRRWCRSR